MKLVPITDAQRLAERVGANRIAVVYLDDAFYAITTWGAARADCDAAKAWATGAGGKRAVNAIAGERRVRGFVYTAAESDQTGELAQPEAAGEDAELRRQLGQAAQRESELLGVIAGALEDLAAGRIADAQGLLENAALVFTDMGEAVGAASACAREERP